MNRDHTVFHLREAAEKLHRTIGAIEASSECDHGVLLTTPARREQLALQRKANVTIDIGTWNHHGVRVDFVVSEELLSRPGEAIRQTGGEVVAEGSRAMGPYLFLRDPDGYLVELFGDHA